MYLRVYACVRVCTTRLRLPMKATRRLRLPMKATWLLRECVSASRAIRMCMRLRGAEWHFHSEFRTTGWASGASHIKQRWIRLGKCSRSRSGTSTTKSTPLDGHQGWFEVKVFVCRAAARHLVVHNVACLRMRKVSAGGTMS